MIGQYWRRGSKLGILRSLGWGGRIDVDGNGRKSLIQPSKAWREPRLTEW